tara:strand:- start:5003 stop:5521 length:519 start_codon:yes stop_codon:yes gene_type:complete
VTRLYTLKLDASWRPIEVVDSFKGFSLVYSGRAQVVEDYPHEACAFYYFPSVVVLKNYIRKKEFQVSPSRRAIFHRDRYVCQYCSNKFSKGKLTLDHVIPKSKGGLKSWDNLVTCCSPCNQKKGDKTPSEACMELISIPSVPKNNVWTAPHWVTSKMGKAKIPNEWKKFLGD